MKKRKITDISTEEKKKEVFDRFNSFASKNQAHEYFRISDNKQGSEYLKEIATSVGFDLNLYKERKKKSIRYCKECGKEITQYSTTGMCADCQHKSSRIVDRPSREELKEMIRTIPFTTIAKQYGVSDNAIRKWCKYYNLPYKVSEIKKYCQYECS